MSATLYFSEALERFSVDVIAERIGLHSNTVQRWQEQNKVPSHYADDLLRLLGKTPKASSRSAQDKDQYYTKPETAKRCFDCFVREVEKLGIDLSEYRFIEPAAGCGYFYDLLPARRRIGIDIEPTTRRIIKADYLTWHPQKKHKYIVIGNPPFGLRGHLALQFIHHSWLFADIVGFILPQLFSSDGKGSAAGRVKGYDLAYSMRLPANSFQYPDGRDVKIHTLFQIWTKVNIHKIKKIKKKTCNQFIKVYSLSDGGTPSSTRNKAMIGRCDIYIPSTCYGSMQAQKRFQDLPHQRGYGVVIRRNKRDISKLLFSHNWNKSAFRSTNSAVNMRKSLIENVVIKGGFVDE